MFAQCLHARLHTPSCNSQCCVRQLFFVSSLCLRHCAASFTPTRLAGHFPGMPRRMSQRVAARVAQGTSAVNLQAAIDTTTDWMNANPDKAIHMLGWYPVCSDIKHMCTRQFEGHSATHTHTICSSQCHQGHLVGLVSVQMVYTWWPSVCWITYSQQQAVSQQVQKCFTKQGWAHSNATPV